MSEPIDLSELKKMAAHLQGQQTAMQAMLGLVLLQHRNTPGIADKALMMLEMAKAAMLAMPIPDEQIKAFDDTADAFLTMLRPDKH